MLRTGYIVLILIIFVSSGCGGKRLKGNESAEVLYRAAVNELTNKKRRFPWVFTGTDYNKVFKLLKEIQIRYPYSPYATLAELRTADAYFKKEEYEQASIEYEEFIKRHPAHQETPYATYRLALSHYKQKRSYDRDPTSTREALKWFNIFVEKYPDSPEVNEAKKKIAKCRNILAKREIYIGKFYEKRKNYKAAAERFKVVVNQYPDTRFFEESLFFMGRSYFKAGEVGLAKEALSRVVEEFPKAKYHDEASKLLARIEEKQSKENKNIKKK
jgi:outer membrane protein assembly factor BamD